jgi:hypothetical protein
VSLLEPGKTSGPLGDPGREGDCAPRFVETLLARLLTGFNLTSKALNDMTPGNLLILAGLLAVGLGLWWKFAPEGLPRFPLGNLPGDIRIEREGFRMYVPVTTCIVLSGLFWLVQFLMNRSVP